WQRPGTAFRQLSGERKSDVLGCQVFESSTVPHNCGIHDALGFRRPVSRPAFRGGAYQQARGPERKLTAFATSVDGGGSRTGSDGGEVRCPTESAADCRGVEPFRCDGAKRAFHGARHRHHHRRHGGFTRTNAAEAGYQREDKLVFAARSESRSVLVRANHVASGDSRTARSPGGERQTGATKCIDES